MQTLKKTFGTRTNLSALTTKFRSMVRINPNYINPILNSFVSDKAMQLVETPAIQPEVKLLAPASLSYSFDILQNNCSSIAVCNNLFAYAVVYPSLETSLPARNLFKQFLGRTSAFGLKLCPQTLEFEPIPFNLISAKELPIACYSNVVYSDINTNLKSVRNLVDVDVSGKCDIKEKSAVFVNSKQSSLITPRQIFKIIFRNIYWNINPFFKRREPDFLFGESESPLVKSQRHHFLKLRFSTLISLNRFKGLGSYPVGVYNELGRQIKQLSGIVIAQMMQFVSVMNVSLKSFISNVLNSFGILLHSFKKLVVSWNLYFDSGYGLHIANKDEVIYKSYGQMSSGIGGWQFLPRLKSWVYLPYEL